jgi:YD repeat-containing protein
MNMKRLFGIILVLLIAFSVSAQKKMTDSGMEGLKGQVKYVLSEYEIIKYNGKRKIIEPRVKWMEYFYDREGNLTERLFPLGNSRYIYKIIDGFKTFKSSSIKAETSDKDTAKVLRQDNQSQQNTKPDERYSMKFLYEYDTQGRVIEETSYWNNGDYAVVSTFDYNDKNQVIKKIQDTPSAVTTYTLKYDDNGNLIEENIDRDVRGGVNFKYQYFYEDYKLDAKGNWIQRKQTEKVEENGKTQSKVMIYYRKIAYY